jgi:putative membrane protein
MEIFGMAFGFILGFLSSVIPGLNSNTIASVILRLDLDHMTSPAAIAAMAASHSVFGFIPAIFFFIPDPETVISVLPGHRLLMKGRGAYALTICAFSSMAAIATAIILLPISYFLLPFLYSLFEPHMLAILSVACLFLLASERKVNSVALATGIFLLSGALGLFALQTPILRDPLLPVFCGMFAVSGILLSFREGTGIPKQVEERIDVPMSYLPYIFTGVVLGMLSDLFPGISTPAQIAVFASVFLYLNAPKFLALVSSIAISHSLFALVATASIGKARTGSAVAIRELIGVSGVEQTMWLVGISILSVSLAVIVLLLLAKRMPNLISNAPTLEIGVLVLVYLSLIVFIFDGPFGLLVMGTGAAIGVIPPIIGVRRTHLMGAILVPSLVSLAGLSGNFLSLVLG